MVKLIKAVTRLDAWIRATEHLLGHSARLNLVLDIERPAIGGSNVISSASISIQS